MTYKDNRTFGDKFMPQVKAILGQVLLRDDFTEEDQKHNTDLMVLRMNIQRIGVRIRRFDDVWDGCDKRTGCMWRDQFTIRYQMASGYPTEFDKILYNHWGNYFFYGIAEPQERFLVKWTLGDLDAFRVFVNKGISQNGEEEFVKDRICHNTGEKDSSFLTFAINEIPDFVIAQSKAIHGRPDNMAEWCSFLLPCGIAT